MTEEQGNITTNEAIKDSQNPPKTQPNLSQKQEKTLKNQVIGQKNEKESKVIEQEQNNQKQKTQTPEEKIKELTETLKRLQAEFENSQKRNQKHNEEFKNFANAKLIEEMLPVLDSLEHGTKHNPEFAHIYEQLYSVLKKKGLEKIKVEEGENFNHDKMECMLQEKNQELAEDAVASILISGYILNGKILRPVKVSVNVLEKKNTNCLPENQIEAKKGEEKKEKK